MQEDEAEAEDEDEAEEEEEVVGARRRKAHRSRIVTDASHVTSWRAVSRWRMCVRPLTSTGIRGDRGREAEELVLLLA